MVESHCRENCIRATNKQKNLPLESGHAVFLAGQEPFDALLQLLPGGFNEPIMANREQPKCPRRVGHILVFKIGCVSGSIER